MPGVLDREGGLLGLLIDGLSQEEKKSSGSPAGVLVPLPSLASVASSTTTLSGFLFDVSRCLDKTFPANSLLLIRLHSPCQLILVFVRCVARVFCLWVLARQRC
jgi:hypothetical protein